MALSTAPARVASNAAAKRGTRPSRRRVVAAAIAGLILVHLVLRGWVLTRGGFYWDDLVLIGRAGAGPIWSWDYLGHNHDGHFMPGAFAVAGITTALAPLNWFAAATTLLAGQLLASLAVARMLIVVAGLRAATVVVLAFFLFSPLTVPAFAWWASGLNSLPTQAAMAWVVADAVLLCRGPRDGARPSPAPRTIAVRSAVVCAVGLAFFEKSVLILPVAVAVALLCVASQGRRQSVGGTMRLVAARGRGLWIALAAVTVVWAVAFALVARPGAGDHSAAQTARLVWRAVERGVLPAFVGGPWTWDRWTPSPPFGQPGSTMIVAGALVAVALVAAALLRRRGAGPVVAFAIGYVVVAQGLISWNRSSTNTALELAQTMRYLPDAALVLALAAAIVVASPARRARSCSVPGRVVVAVGAMAVTVSAIVSTTAFADRWHDNPTAAYLANARSALAANASTPMFDQALPLEVLLPVTYPNNQISRVFARLPHRPRFGNWTDRLQVLSPSGTMTPGAVTRARGFVAGIGACDRPEITGRTTLPLDGPVIRWRWTVQIPYCATADGMIEVAVGDGRPVTVPVRAGLHPLWVQATGSGDAVIIRPLTPGVAMHVAAGVVGEVYDPSLI